MELQLGLPLPQIGYNNQSVKEFQGRDWKKKKEICDVKKEKRGTDEK